MTKFYSTEFAKYLIPQNEVSFLNSFPLIDDETLKNVMLYGLLNQICEYMFHSTNVNKSWY